MTAGLAISAIAGIQLQAGDFFMFLHRLCFLLCDEIRGSSWLEAPGLASRGSPE